MFLSALNYEHVVQLTKTFTYIWMVMFFIPLQLSKVLMCTYTEVRTSGIASLEKIGYSVKDVSAGVIRNAPILVLVYTLTVCDSYRECK